MLLYFYLALEATRALLFGVSLLCFFLSLLFLWFIVFFVLFVFFAVLVVCLIVFCLFLFSFVCEREREGREKESRRIMQCSTNLVVRQQIYTSYRICHNSRPNTQGYAFIIGVS